MKDLLEYLRYARREFWSDSGWVMIEQDCRRPLAVVLMAWYTFKRACMIMVCGFKGHAWEDDGSYAGPDSGADSMTCARCGKHFRHVYY